MIFYINKEVGTPGFECTKKVLLLWTDADNAYVTTDLLYTKSVFEKLKLSEGGRYCVFPDMNVPVITVEPTSSATGVTKIYDAVINALDKCTTEELEMEVLKRYRAALAKQLDNPAIATKLISAIKVYRDWSVSGELTSALSIDAVDVDADLRSHTMKVIEEINSTFVSAINSIPPSENYTHFQEECTSEFFVEIPSRQVIADAENIFQVLPKKDELCVPYSDPAAYMPDYKQHGVSKFLFPLIEGEKENNGKPLYNNEEKFFMALTEWVQYNMREEFGTVDGGVLDKISESYLFGLASTLYMRHWQHCKFVPAEIADNIETEDTDVESIFVFDVRGGQEAPKYNAVIILQEYLKDVSAVLGYEAVIDAVIQISRWGSRKPTAICFENYEKEFRLADGLVKNKIGNIKDYFVKAVNGASCAIEGVIVDESAIRDPAVGYDRWNFPVGVVTVQHLTNSSAEEMNIYTYYHMVDFIRQVISGDLTVDGISVQDDKVVVADGSVPSTEYTVAELIEHYNATQDELLQFPFFRSKELTDLLVDLQLGNGRMPSNLLCIMNARVADPALMANISEANFGTKDELIDRISNGKVSSKVTAVELMIAKTLLPVYQAVGKCDNATLPVAVQNWQDAMQGFAGEVSWFGQPVTVATTESSTTPITSFGNNIATAESAPKGSTSAKTVSEQVSWLKDVPADAPLCRVVCGDAANETLCYCYVEKVAHMQGGVKKPYRRYTLLVDPAGRSVSDAPESAVRIERIFAVLLHNIYMEQVKGSSMRQAFFENGEALNAIKKLLQERSKVKPKEVSLEG